MPWPVALAAVLLSVVLSLPFAHLFEVGGATIWAPALLHWMAASALLPLLTLTRASGAIRDADCSHGAWQPQPVT
jgi:hypothetical protein